MSKAINTDRKYREGLENNFLAHIGYEYSQQVCEELDREKDQWKDIEVPGSLDQWFTDFAKLEKKRKRRKERRQKMFQYSRRAAIFLLGLVVINFVLVKNVDAYRVRWRNTITRLQQKFTQIDYVDDTTDIDEYIPKDWVGRYYLTYLPEGYQLSGTTNQDGAATISYTDQEGKQILFSQFNQNISMRIDTEDEEITYLSINGDHEAYCLQKDNSLIVSWRQEDITFQLYTPWIGQEEIIRIAESIALLK